MATQPLGESSQQLWDDTLGRLLRLSNTTLKRNGFLEARVAELEMEVDMWHGAHAVEVEAFAKAFQTQISTLNRQISTRDLFENQNPLILCIVNGDEKLFNGSLIVQGQHGGMFAAQGLTQTIATHLSTEDLTVFGRLSFWITVYFNRRQLLDTLVGNNICSVQQFDAFLAGFSQCSPRFSLVDVGYGANGTDEKIREHVQTYARFPQTLRVFLAGGNDPQYISTFDALKNEQLLGKLVLLLADGDTGSSNIPLPSLRVEGLFMNQKPQLIMQKPAPLSVSCVTTNGGLISPQSPGSHTSGGRTIDPSLPLHKQNPPPCNEHYLMSCSKMASILPAACKYSHEYILTSDQLASLASNAKKAPCNWLKNGLVCPHGDTCCWGHSCPNGRQCFHLSKGKCWFKGDSMHGGPSESHA
ncbi:hypothetical protein DFH09DRAFT_1303734 [Mycena vulgaris]|nr:hypothetical protein DFH09DRAFT_1303734 [Mycena vulgaris]